MTPDQIKIMNLQGKIARVCAKINLNTRKHAISYCGKEIYSLELNKTVLASFTYISAYYLEIIETLEKALQELKEFYAMNRIVERGGE